MADTYTVIDQRETYDFSSGNRLTKVIQVSFRTSSGREGSVDIPVALYSADAVRAAIEPRVAEMDAVDNL